MNTRFIKLLFLIIGIVVCNQLPLHAEQHEPVFLEDHLTSQLLPDAQKPVLVVARRQRAPRKQAPRIARPRRAMPRRAQARASNNPRRRIARPQGRATRLRPRQARRRVNRVQAARPPRANRVRRRQPRAQRAAGAQVQKRQRARQPRARRARRQARRQQRRANRRRANRQARKANRVARRKAIHRARLERLRNHHYYVSSYTGFSVGFVSGAGVGVLVGTSTVAFLQPANVAFWGPRYYYGYLGCWSYPRFGCWYHPHFHSWYYPWSRCWFYPHYSCWHYPVVGVTVYLEPQAKRYVIVENETDKEAYFGVYYREPVKGGYYLYGIGSPKIIKNQEKIKVTLPPHGSSKDYIVIVDRDKASFKQRLMQDEKGSLLSDKDITQEPAYDIANDNLAVEELSKTEQDDFNNIKQKIREQREPLSSIEDRIKKGSIGEKTSEPVEGKAASVQNK